MVTQQGQMSGPNISAATCDIVFNESASKPLDKLTMVCPAGRTFSMRCITTRMNFDGTAKIRVAAASGFSFQVGHRLQLVGQANTGEKNRVFVLGSGWSG